MKENRYKNIKNMEAIIVKDFNGQPMKLGNFVIYHPTGTKGYITEIMEDEEGIWALVDKTNLYYKAEVLAVISETKEKEVGEKIFTHEEIGHALEKEKDAAKISEMGDVSIESGG